MFTRILAALAALTLAPQIPHREQELPDTPRGDGLGEPPSSQGQCFSDVRCKTPTKSGSQTMQQCSQHGGKSFRAAPKSLCLPLSKNRDDFFVDHVQFVRDGVVITGRYVLATSSQDPAPALAPLAPRRRWILPPPSQLGMRDPSDPHSAYSRIKQAAEAAGYETVDFDRM